jgi:hypothetical protein
MKWIGKISFSLAAVAALFCAAGAPTANAQGKKPNIVFMLTDNLRASANPISHRN